MSTEQELKRITANTPEHLTKGLMKDVVDTSEEDIVRDNLKRDAYKPETRARVEKLLAQGAFRRSEQVVDEKKVAELDRYNAAKVQAAIRDGRLPDPKTDPFFKKRMERMKR